MIDSAMLRSCIVILLMLAANMAYVQAVGANLPESERTVIALFGDSITVGENLSLNTRPIPAGATDHQGCPSVYLTGILLNQRARPTNVNCSTSDKLAPIYDGNNEVRNAIVANWGIGGSSSGRGARRIRADLADTKAQLVGNNYIVLIMYGTNDRNFGISTVTSRDNISSMITTARSSSLGFTPIIGAVTPRDDRTGPGPSGIRALNNQIRSIASQRNAPYVDHFTSFINFPGTFEGVLDQEQFSSGPIRLHPNDQGYLLIAETWFEQQLKNRIPVVSVGNPNIAPIVSLLLDED